MLDDFGSGKLYIEMKKRDKESMYIWKVYPRFFTSSMNVSFPARGNCLERLATQSCLLCLLNIGFDISTFPFIFYGRRTVKIYSRHDSSQRII
jgi:hypothetical protein